MEKKCCDKKIHKTSIGGQAVIEGVMMRGPRMSAIAVRKSDGEIVLDKKPIENTKRPGWMKLPIIRGCIGFFESMITGVKALMFSAQFFDLEDDSAQPSKFEKWLDEKFGDKITDIVIYFSVFLSLIMGIGLFMLLPGFLYDVAHNIFDFPIENSNIRTLIEGGVRMVIFLIYILLVSQMKDIQRVFMYHGAEHKSIHCYESLEELTVENVKKHTRLHPRCGTSFLLIVMVVSIFVFMVIPSFPNGDIWWMRAFYKILLLPFVAGFAYEIIKFAGRHDNLFTKILSAPGLWMQYLTTREPDDSMIEVAITSLKAVLPDNLEEDKW